MISMHIISQIYIISQMLSFTNNQKSQTQNINQLDFQPLIITNKVPNADPFPRRSQKKISKTIFNNNNVQSGQKFSKQSSRKSKERSSQALLEQQVWKQGGKVEIFDRKLRKNQLADQQRRIKADQKRIKKQQFNNIVNNEVQIRSKTLNLQKYEQKQILKLRKLIQKQREEKQKNDRNYEQKLKLIEKQRSELIKLQRKIQQNGVKHQKEFKKEINVLLKNQIPSNDRGKCHQDHRNEGPKQQLTQSEFIHERNQLRQKQLQYLTDQRERAVKKLPTVDYNPTIIPLLSRASYKIISTHISTLVELFIDDMLEEEVYLLEQIQMKERYHKQKDKQKQILNDYYRQLGEFVDQAQEIQNRVGRYQTMKFQDLYIPKNHYKQDSKKTNLKYYEEKHFKLEGLNDDNLEEIQTRKERFVKYVNNFDEYKKNNLAMFQKVTEEMIDEAIMKMAKELDNGSSDFVQLIFRKQFE